MTIIPPILITVIIEKRCMINSLLNRATVTHLDNSYTSCNLSESLL